MFLTHAYSLDTWAGVGILDRELALYRQLPPEVSEIGLLSYGGRSDIRQLAGEDRFKVLTNWMGLPPRLRSSWMAMLHPNFLRKADVLKTNQLNGAAAAIRAKNIWRKPLIVRAGNIWTHAVSLRFGPDSAEFFNAKSLEEKFFQSADRIMVTDEDKASYVADEYGIHRSVITVIPNYVDTELFIPDEIQSGEKNEITFVGRLSSPKLPNLLIEAVADMDVTVNIFGSGPDRNKFESIAEGARADIRFHGNVASSELAKCLQRSTLFVLPTVLEGQPKALLEAMSTGLAVVASSAPGVTDVIDDGKTGILAENTVGAFREAITELLSDSNRRSELGKNARNYVLNNNALSTIVSKEIDVYRELTTA